MKISNPAIFDYIKESNGESCRLKIVSIGDWNMDITPTVLLAHGLTYANIREVSVLIRNDPDTARYSLNYNATAYPNSGWLQVLPASIKCAAEVGGFFDSVTFDATSYNRGWIFIWYVD